jgi:hypothetical protein
MSQDSEFQRSLYREVRAEVLKFDPSISTRDAWVWKAGRDHWEFHYEDFYSHGSAGGAFDARANGWIAFLASQTEAA